MAAIVTPMRDGQIDHEAFRRLVEHLIVGGLNGLIVCGTTGEAATLSPKEQLSAVKTALEQANKRIPIIGGVGAQSTRVAIDMSKQLAEVGADGILVLTPPYNKPNQEGLYQHFKAVAEAVPAPQVLYNVPGRTARRVEVETLARLAEIPNIVATKDATGDMVFASNTLEACGDKLTLLSGDDATAFPFMALGGRGSISVVGNVAPRFVADLCEACLEGRWDEARAAHFKIMPLFRALFADTNPIPVKTAVAMQGLIGPELRLPMVPMPDHAKAALREALTQAGVL